MADQGAHLSGDRKGYGRLSVFFGGAMEKLSGMLYELNRNRDCGEVGKSYALVGLGENKEEDISVPSSYEGLPVVAVNLSGGKIAPWVRSLSLPDTVKEYRCDPSVLPNLQAIHKKPLNQKANHLYSKDGILFYGHIDRASTCLVSYPPNHLGETFEMAEKTYLGRAAFSGARSLKSISLPLSLHIIPENCFRGCANLESLDVPKNVMAIEAGAFRGCSNLRAITFHAEESDMGLTTIGPNAFSGCLHLEELHIPGTLKSMDLSALDDLPSLRVLQADYSGYETIDGVLFGNDFFGHPVHLMYYPACKEEADGVYYVPEGTKFLRRGCFAQAKKIHSVVLPLSIQMIEEGAFASSNVESLLFLGDEQAWEQVDKTGIPQGMKTRFKP
ncbi:MAG: leucine-rich repeat domain-containing protein [Bacilli bacterium]|nr:leucine-rich repeat domain-containing protein [Bacilli bacterium]